jgi:hypothetical protein
VKSLGHYRILLSPRAVAEYASTIAGKDIPQNWTKAFQAHHSDLRGGWITGLEACCAKALNHTNVAGFYEILVELVMQYYVLPQNLYNMDEKGVQLGLSKS